MFFSGEKNQKTFISAPLPCRATQKILPFRQKTKVFLRLFFKKEDLSLF
jgi:hypothetical protein